MHPNAPARSLLWLAIGALILSVITVVAATVYAGNTQTWVEHSTQVFQTTRSAILDVTNAALRANENAPAVAESRASVLARFDSVVALTADNPGQQSRIRSVAELARQWAAAAPTDPRMATGLALAIDANVKGFLEEEQRLYNERADRLRTTELLTALTVALELLFVGAVVLTYGRRITQHIAAAAEQQTRLEEQATELEEQAAELEVSNHELSEAVDRAEQERMLARGFAGERSRATALLDAALNSAPVAFALLDANLRFLQVNARWAEMSGQPVDDHDGRSFEEIPFTSDGMGASLGAVTRARLSGALVSNVEITGRPAQRDDGPVCHWLLSAAPVRPAEGAIMGVAVTLLDVTDHTRTTEQLLHVQKMEAVGRLAGGIAHDFNNSLAVINAYASMMATSNELNAENRERVDEIADAVQRAAGLTQQLLSFGRRQISQPRRLDVTQVARSMIPMLVRLIPATITLETSLDAEASTVMIDPSQLEQVLLNLVTNAVHAMGDGGTLALGTTLLDLDESYATSHAAVVPGPYVMLSVSDTGTGMDEATMSRIFEPFFTTKDAGQGTGLGLASVYAIVKNAGGHIWCYSEVGKGTSFKVYLPFVSASPAQVEERPTPTLDHHDHAAILLVEDDEKLRPAVVRLLQQAGYNVTDARNGNAALEILDTQAPSLDLVITDLVMPGLSGRELSEFISERYPGLRVLFTSGYTDDEVVRRGMIERGYPFVQKPFTRDQLLSAINQVLAAD